MSSFPGSPRTLPGAIVGADPFNPLARVVVFQYNPDEVTRTVRPRTPPSGGSAADAQRIWGAPTESIAMTIELDATNGLEAADPTTAAFGVGAKLAALEMLLYPNSAKVIVDTALLMAGTIEVVPPMGHLTILVWGTGRAVPVKVQSLTITEQAFSTKLAPIRASVAIALDVLTYDDLGPTNPGFALFLAHQVAKEALSNLGAIQGTTEGAMAGA
jgi:hypothetical protein